MLGWPRSPRSRSAPSLHHLPRAIGPEREVLVLLAEGHSLKDIATRLNLSVKTVDAHKVNLMRKLDLHSVAELTKYAIREGLTLP